VGSVSHHSQCFQFFDGLEQVQINARQLDLFFSDTAWTITVLVRKQANIYLIVSMLPAKFLYLKRYLRLWNVSLDL
jgi:hypothetical protein